MGKHGNFSVNCPFCGHSLQRDYDTNKVNCSRCGYNKHFEQAIKDQSTMKPDFNYGKKRENEGGDKNGCF